jgi:bifunctional non-homologous end joining protein LigD
MTLASRVFPEWVEPMAATLTQERFSGPEWIFERKLDGIRLLAFKNGPAVNLFSRNRLPQDIPAVADAMASLPASDVILDGEITWGRGGLAYHVFDIMWLDGRDVTSLPLDERRALLDQLPLQPPFERVISLDDPKPWERACSEGWEGVIAKRRTSKYEHRRSPHWLKMKCEATQELVVGGFTDPQGVRVGLGALLVGYFEDPGGSAPADPLSPSLAGTPSPRSAPAGAPVARLGDFVYAGKVGTGFDTKLLLDLRGRLDALETPEPPFTKALKLPRVRAHWVRPEIVVQVAFIEWTVHGKLRHPRLLRVRFDKAAHEVTREVPAGKGAP